jgi:hypothetical protein
MPVDIIDTVGNQIQVLDDGTTVADIMFALGWVKSSKEKQRIREKRRAPRPYKPTGNPRGRPKKVSEDPPAEN